MKVAPAPKKRLRSVEKTCGNPIQRMDEGASSVDPGEGIESASDEERVRHEAGHAVVAAALYGSEFVTVVAVGLKGEVLTHALGGVELVGAC